MGTEDILPAMDWHAVLAEQGLGGGGGVRVRVRVRIMVVLLLPRVGGSSNTPRYASWQARSLV